MDYLWNGNSSAKCYLDKLVGWLNDKSTGDASQIRSGYYLNGEVTPDVNYNNPAFVGPFGVGSMVYGDQAFCNSIYNELVNCDSGGYYNSSLHVLTLLAMTGNMWNYVEKGETSTPVDLDCNGLSKG